MIVLLVMLAANDARFEDIASQVGAVTHRQSCEQLEAFVAAHANDPDADRALLLEAQLKRADADDEPAIQLLDRILSHGASSSWWRDAALERAQLKNAASVWKCVAKEIKARIVKRIEGSAVILFADAESGHPRRVFGKGGGHRRIGHERR